MRIIDDEDSSVDRDELVVFWTGIRIHLAELGSPEWHSMSDYAIQVTDKNAVDVARSLFEYFYRTQDVAREFANLRKLFPEVFSEYVVSELMSGVTL